MKHLEGIFNVEWLGMRAFTREFEGHLGELPGLKNRYAAATSTGTSALHNFVGSCCGDMLATDKVTGEVKTLPLYSSMKSELVQRIVDEVAGIFAKYNVAYEHAVCQTNSS